MADKLKIASIGIGTSIVLIHGWGLNAGVFEPLAKSLSKQYSVTCLDLPGYGNNVDVTLDDYSLEAIVKKIAAVIDDNSVVVGWSLGGLVASKLALDFPEKCSALATVASSPYFVESDDWSGIQPNVLSLFHRQLSQDTKKTIENFLKIQAMGSPHVRQDIKVIRDLVMQYPMASKETLDKSLLLLEQVDLRSELSQISQPFLRLYGRLDGLVPKGAIEKISTLAPNSQQVIFEKASHAPFISHFDSFKAALVDWLKTL